MFSNIKLAIAATFCITLSSIAQVGVNNSDPKSLLDISASSSTTPSSTDGILIPRVSQFPSVSPNSDQDGMMAFLTQDIPGYSRGFHYWDNNLSTPKWVPIGAEEWKPGVNPSGDDLIYALRAKATGTDMVITNDGRIGFGTDDPVERFEFKGPGDNDFQITSANPNPPNFILYNTGGTLESPSALAANGEIGSFIVKTHDGSTIRENGGFRFYMDGIATPGSTPSRFVINTTPQGSTSQQERIVVRNNGNTGISESNPTATLHLRAGGSNAQSAPIKLTSGSILSTPERGALEYDGTNLYFTNNSGTRSVINGSSSSSSSGPSTTSANIYYNVPAQNSVDSWGVYIAGAQLGMSCSCAPETVLPAGLTWSCYISAANTVKVRVSNFTNSTIVPGSIKFNITPILQ
ncbi:hypothetical protein [Patiriisocius marinus]|nr:hypothetical protein [Patiriisocius marinus]